MTSQAEEIAVIKNEIGHIKKSVDKIDKTITTFISCADNKYAEKERVDKIDKKVNKINIQLAKLGGGIIVGVFLIEISIKVIFGV